MKKERILIINKRLALIGVVIMTLVFSYFQEGEKDTIAQPKAPSSCSQEK
ncbi:hypothetical protein [Aliivibrio fischeri]|nr:hypothetical protein [Aliivibrio fischeri]GGK36024.1 hypothetical protein GCM10007987_19270 [Aliivibrio fischeri]